jgi:hypothetical protein
MIADIHIGQALLITVLIVLAIVCLLVWLFRGRHGR